MHTIANENNEKRCVRTGIGRKRRTDGGSTLVEVCHELSPLPSIDVASNYRKQLWVDQGCICQHGFVPGRSCATQLLQCMDYWTNMLDQSHSVDTIYLDFAKGSFHVNSTNGSQVSVSNIAQKIPTITLVSIMKACQILGCNSEYFWRYSLSNFLFCFAFLPS